MAVDIERISFSERKEKMATVSIDKEFDKLLSNPEIRDVFIRLRDK